MALLADLVATTMCIACGLLLIAGIQKVKKPASTLAAARSMGIPASAVIVRILAVAEITVASYWLITGRSFAAWTVTLAYALFAVVALLAIRRLGKEADCGCFGQHASPLGSLHVALNACAAAIAAAAAAIPDVPDAEGLLSGAVFDQVLGLIGLVAATYFAYALLTVAAQLFAQFQEMEAE